MGHYSAIRVTASIQKNEDDENTRHAQKWKAPYTIVVALLLGVGLALGQHFIYARIDGQQVAEFPLSQAWVSRIGTALAFLVKMALTISVETSFVQHQWLKLHHSSFRVKDIDAMTGILGSLIYVFQSSIWFRQPLLTLLALVAWTIPLSAVVSPGALSVLPTMSESVTKLQVPQPFYNESAYANFATHGAFDQGVTGSSDMYQLLFQVASAGQPANLPSTFENQTYQLQFVGPALKCSETDTAFTEALINQLGPEELITYAAWVPPNQDSLTQINASSFATLDSTSTDTARMYVAAQNYNITSGYIYFVVECDLYNATYDVDFIFQGSNQSRQLSISEWLNPVPPPHAISVPLTLPPDQVAYGGMMEAFGKLLVGELLRSQYGFFTVVSTSQQIVRNIDWTLATTTQSGLEELFQNFTLSLMSNPAFTKNSSMARWVDVTVMTWPTVYKYAPFDLVTAYAASVLACLICALVGLHAVWRNHASYQNMFSTFVRSTNDPGFRFLFDMNDPGADPLPEKLGKARILLPGSSRTQSKA